MALVISLYRSCRSHLALQNALHDIFFSLQWRHRNAMRFQISGNSDACPTFCSGQYQRKYRSSASLVCVKGIHWYFKGLQCGERFHFRASCYLSGKTRIVLYVIHCPIWYNCTSNVCLSFCALNCRHVHRDSRIQKQILYEVAHAKCQWPPMTYTDLNYFIFKHHRPCCFLVNIT